MEITDKASLIALLESQATELAQLRETVDGMGKADPVDPPADPVDPPADDPSKEELDDIESWLKED